MLNAKTDVSWGTDPEAFFSKDDRIIGSEKLIPKYGLRNAHGKIVRDGVQFEFNPRSERTVKELGANISGLFAKLQDRLKRNNGIGLDFNGLVEVDRAELDSLEPRSRILGCMPSFNIYGAKPIMVNPIEYRKRSSGGHLHIGLPKNLMALRRKLVPLCDILVGNTCVLLDRDPGAAERRENYGRAGECRFPEHGLEYRTTSNFWLRDYTLMSFVFGMTNMAVSVYSDAVAGNKDAWEALTKVVKLETFVKAINTNDFALAMRNFKRIVPVLQKHLPKTGFPLSPDTVETFMGLAQNVREQGLEGYFPTHRIVPGWVQGQQTEFTKFLGN